MRTVPVAASIVVFVAEVYHKTTVFVALTYASRFRKSVDVVWSHTAGRVTITVSPASAPVTVIGEDVAWYAPIATGLMVCCTETCFVIAVPPIPIVRFLMVIAVITAATASIPANCFPIG